MGRSEMGYIGWLTSVSTRRCPRERNSPTVGESLIRLGSRTLRVLRTAKPSRVAVDETAVKINGQWFWLDAAIDIETKLILDDALFGRHGTDPAAAFLHQLEEKHDLSEATFLVD